MNQESEASSSNQPPPESDKAKHVEALLKECKKLRELVESVKNVHTITFYSRLVFTACEAIKTIIRKFETTYPTLEADDIEACEYYWEITCNLSKEIRAMFVDAVSTRSPASNRGGDSKKVLMWKKQCDKNMEKIESLIKNTILLGDDSTWLDQFWLFGIFHGGVSGVLVILQKILMMKEIVDDDYFENLTEGAFEKFEICYRDLMSDMLDKVREGVKEQADLPEESSLNNLEEKENDALKELQEDDIVKRFCEATTLTQKNLQEAEIAEARMDSGETEINNKLQEAEIHKRLQEDEALKKIQEEETLKELQEEEALNELQIVEETKKKLQQDEETKNLAEEEALKKLQEEDTQTKNLAEEEALKNLREEDTQKKLQEEEEEEALKKLQEEETQKNLQEREVNKKVQEEEGALKKSQEEENTGYEIIKFGHFTFKMKNGVLERVLD